MSEALIVLDMQTDLLDAKGRFPVAQDQVEALLHATNRALDGARQRGSDVACVVNAFRPWDPGNLFRSWCCVRGRDGSEVDPRVHVPSGAAGFEKWRGDAFCNDGLGRWVAQRDVNALTVAGVYANACVLATVRGALERGLRVTVLADAVAAKDESARCSGLEKMKRAGAELMSVDAWLSAGHESSTRAT